jgi:hypothetical protein
MLFKSNIMEVFLYNICLNYILENNPTNIISFYVVTMQKKIVKKYIHWDWDMLKEVLNKYKSLV